MSRNQRLGLVALAVAAAVAAFVIVKPANNEDSQDTAKEAAGETAKTPTGSDAATKPEQPSVQRIVIRGGKPVGGVRELRFRTGELARIEVSSDAPAELHLHGYDIDKEARPGKPAGFRFRAKAEGAFEIENHTAEDAGQDPLVARVVVGPS